MTLTPLATQQAQVLGLSPQQVEDMLSNSAPFSHALGNRRFEQYMLLVNGLTVEAVHLIDQDDIAERHKEKIRNRRNKSDKAVVLERFSDYRFRS